MKKGGILQHHHHQSPQQHSPPTPDLPVLFVFDVSAADVRVVPVWRVELVSPRRRCVLTVQWSFQTPQHSSGRSAPVIQIKKTTIK